MATFTTEAGIDDLTGKKRICQFGNFVRAVLLREQ